MTPYESAQQIYEGRNTHRTFQEDQLLHFHNGYVISTPQLYAQARPVHIDITQPISDQIWDVCDADFMFYTPYINTWYVHIYAGKLDMLFTLLPFRLRYGAFMRRDRLRFYELKHLEARFDNNVRTRCTRRSTTTSATSSR